MFGRRLVVITTTTTIIIIIIMVDVWVGGRWRSWVRAPAAGQESNYSLMDLTATTAPAASATNVCLFHQINRDQATTACVCKPPTSAIMSETLQKIEFNVSLVSLEGNTGGRVPLPLLRPI